MLQLYHIMFLCLFGYMNDINKVYSVYMVYDFLSPGVAAGLGYLLSSDIVSFSKVNFPNSEFLKFERQGIYHKINFK